MKTFSLLAAVLALGLTLTVGDADAAGKRFGGGKSSGMQRDSMSTNKSADAAPGAGRARSDQLDVLGDRIAGSARH